MASKKYVYFFGGGKAEGKGSMKELLGGKGAGLAEMTNIGLPVPAGFTITTEVCDLYYRSNKKCPPGLEAEVAKNIARLEKLVGKRLGDSEDPLLISVRSGAARSMPGMMETILNLGLNDKSVEGLAKKTNNKILDTDVNEQELEELISLLKAVYKMHTKKDFPQDPEEQLWGAINAVFGSWMAEKAVTYRRVEKISGLRGTAVNLVQMVFGNMGETSGTGVCFTRDPNTGENIFYGDLLMNAQGDRKSTRLN